MLLDIFKRFSRNVTKSYLVSVRGGDFFPVGSFFITMFGNVPLNNRLDRFDLKSAADEEIGLEKKF